MVAKSEGAMAPSFWSRQFVDGPTRWQVMFDFCAGVLVPVVCVARDPVVFHASHSGATLGEYRVAGLIVIGIGLLSLTGWIMFRRPAGLFIGLLGAATAFAMLLGVLLLPLTLPRLIALTEVYGLIPFFVALVFFRNGYRAFIRARRHERRTSVIALAALGVFVSLAGPWVGQILVNRQVSEAEPLLVSNVPLEVTHGIGILRSLGPLYDPDRLILEYRAETIPVFQRQIASVYQELTGEDIEWRIAQRGDQ